MNWKCKLGIHDWYVVDWEENYESLRCKLRGNWFVRVINDCSIPLIKKVCLRCSKIDDQIKRAEEIIRREIEASKVGVPHQPPPPPPPKKPSKVVVYIKDVSK